MKQEQSRCHENYDTMWMEIDICDVGCSRKNNDDTFLC